MRCQNARKPVDHRTLVPVSRTLTGTRQKISAGSRLLVVGDSLDPIHSLVGKLGTVC